MRLAQDVGEIGVIEQRPNLDGRNMTMVLAPVKPKEAIEPTEEGKAEPAGTGKGSRRNRAAAEAAAARGEPAPEPPAPAEEPPAPAEEPPAPAEEQPTEPEQQPGAESEQRASA
jgi:translation initiation factor IF-3